VTCTPNHNTQTLARVFKEHVNTLPSDATLHYIMDNLNTHFNDEFCKTVAKLSNVTYDPLRTGHERRQWLQRENKRIVIHFTPFHGSWLNMIEIWFGILNKKCLKHQSFESVQILQETIEELLKLGIHTFLTHSHGHIQEKGYTKKPLPGSISCFSSKVNRWTSNF